MKPELESLVGRMIAGRITYSEAVHEFRKAFITVALQDNNGNQSRTAEMLRVHRNTLARALADLDIAAERRPVQNVKVAAARKRA